MKKILLFTAIGAFAIAGCTSMPEYDEQEALYPTLTKEQIQANVQNVFGTTFDPNQDWTMTTKGSVKVTADADFNDIVKVQILSESPYLNKDAMVLNQALVNKGETVELAYEAPKGFSRLIAACVNSSGEYFIKSFDINATQVSFSGLAKARTRGGSETYPVLSDLSLDYSNSIESFNAMRAQEANNGNTDSKISIWKNSNWEEERLWKVTDKTNESNGWQIVKGTVVRAIDEIDSEEKQSLEDVFQTYMGGFENLTNKYNNIEAVRNTSLFELNNYLTSDGNPLIITPVEMVSFELGNLYYYYFDPADMNGMSESEKVKYLKALPKFKAINCSYTREEAKNKGYIEVASNNRSYLGFFKTHEYLLPFYGDQREFPKYQEHELATTDVNNIYRISHGKKDSNGETLYLTYLNKTDNQSPKLAYLYEDDNENLANQLWQIFDLNGKKILYNIGSQYYLITGNNKGEYTNYSSNKNSLKDNLYEFVDKDDYILIKSNWGYMGSDIIRKSGSYRVSLNKPENDGDWVKWNLEKYNGVKPEGIMSQIDLGLLSFVKTAESNAIPRGYQIGFLHRKGTETNSNGILVNNNGETYGDGRLNKEINTYPNFSTAVEQYGMRLTDPRIAIFKANGKKYMTFEEGTDCNFTDMVIEINSGVIEEPEPLSNTIQGAVYTFCFEDHQDGDYDMNDVIIKATRMDETHVLFSLEACGAYDELYLRNINGKTLNGKVEIHKLFGVDNTQTFINTQGGGKYEPVQEIVAVPETYSFSNTEKDQIYIYNKTTDKNIKLSTKGDAPLAIVIPCDFTYPAETISINQANESFVKWGQGDNACYDWYKNNDSSKVFSSVGFIISEKTKQAFPEYFGNSQ